MSVMIRRLAAGAAVLGCGYDIHTHIHTNTRYTQTSPRTFGLNSYKFDQLGLWRTIANTYIPTHTPTIASCETDEVKVELNTLPCVEVVAEIPEGSTFLLDDTDPHPLIFRHTRGVIPRTRIDPHTPLEVIMQPGGVLRDVRLVGVMSVANEAGECVSRDVVGVCVSNTHTHTHALTKEDIEDLMTDAAVNMEQLKSTFELGYRVHVQPYYDPKAATQMLTLTRDRYHTYTHTHTSNNSNPNHNAGSEMSLQSVSLKDLFEELAKRE